MKALTLHQPWASLVALGVKTIETRSWATKHRGPLAIHAAATPAHIPVRVGEYTSGLWADWIDHADPCDCDEDWDEPSDRCMANSDPGRCLFTDEGAHGWSMACTLPLGAVVATCTLIDCAPIFPDRRTYPAVRDSEDGLEVWGRSPWSPTPVVGDIEDQRPYGDFTWGRWAWLLADITPVDPPLPARGRRQLWNWEVSPPCGPALNAEPSLCSEKP